MTAVAEPTVTTIAVPFTPVPLDKFEAIVNACVAHRPWFHDFLWNSGPEKVREAVIAYLADGFNNGKLWEVWRGSELTGILLINELVPFVEGRVHMVFFDSKLADKYQLCLNLMEWAYDKIPVEVLRVEIPTYARALIKYVRKLGYVYEGEGNRRFSWPQDTRPLTADEARLGSRKYHATLYEGSWHDVLLLSQTRDEFARFLKERNDARSQDHSP